MNKKKVKTDTGICKLTLKEGKFVKSHILPRALTILSNKGERPYEAEIGRRTIKRFQGWYDDSLAIHEGEEILSQIDNKAISILRRNYLVWSGWPTSAMSIPCETSQITRFNEHKGLRVIPDVDFNPLKVFFLSILWRAAASSRDDMKYVTVDGKTLEKLRVATLNQDPMSIYDFPVRLHQIQTRGLPHNRSPIIEKESIKIDAWNEEKEYLSCRIYMDGVIAHIALNADEEYVTSIGFLNIGAKKELGIMLNTFESSRANKDLKILFKPLTNK